MRHDTVQFVEGTGVDLYPFFAVLCMAVWNGFNVKGVIS